MLLQKLEHFKFQSDSINTYKNVAYIAGEGSFKFQSDSINTQKVSMMKILKLIL